MFPEITIELFTDAIGLAFVTALTVQLAKNLLPEVHWRAIVCNALTILVAFCFTAWRLSILPVVRPEDVLVGTANAILAASLATFGYEATANMAAALHRGSDD